MYQKAGENVASLPGWQIMRSRYCSHSISSSYRTAKAASIACKQDSRCKAISDTKCDGHGSWETCRDGGTHSGLGSCMYKPANGAHAPTPPPQIKGWNKLKGRYCNRPIKTTFKSASSAQRACAEDKRCMAISDNSCDGKGNWATCRTVTGAHSSTGSCMFKKTSAAVTCPSQQMDVDGKGKGAVGM